MDFGFSDSLDIRLLNHQGTDLYYKSGFKKGTVRVLIIQGLFSYGFGSGFGFHLHWIVITM